MKISNKRCVKTDILLYLFNFVLLFPMLVYSGQNFSIDSYGIMLDMEVHTSAFIGSLRWFGAFVYEIYYSIFKHNPILDSTVDCIIFILLLSIIISVFSYKLNSLFKENNVFSLIIVDLSIIISVVNVWFCDILSFPECIFISAIGFVLCFGAIILFIRAEKLCHYILVSLLLILSTGIYQQYICIFTIYVVAICGVSVLSENKRTVKELFLVYIKPVVLIVGSGVIYFVIGKIVQQILDIKPNSRIALNLSSIIENCLYYVRHQHSYLKGRGFFETEVLTICFLLIGAICAVLIIKEWIKNKHSLKTILLGLSFVCAYCSAYLPGILSTSHSHRAMFALFSVFSLFIIIILVLTDSKIIKSILMVVLVVVLSANIFVSIKNEINLKKQNEADRNWCEQVIQEIEEYEETAETVIHIYYCYDTKTDIAQFSQSAVFHDYALMAMINLFAERTFNVEEMTDAEKSLYFSDNEWDSIDIEEQMVFVGDAVYLCCY